jgi:hypothetical protein
MRGEGESDSGEIEVFSHSSEESGSEEEGGTHPLDAYLSARGGRRGASPAAAAPPPAAAAGGRRKRAKPSSSPEDGELPEVVDLASSSSSSSEDEEVEDEEEEDESSESSEEEAESSEEGSSESDGDEDAVAAPPPRAEPALAPAPAAPPPGVTLVEDWGARVAGTAVSRLLRGARYFDAPDAEGGGPGAGPRCFRCGGGGHLARDCGEAPRERACFLCASLGHDARECPAALCWKCARPGHVAKECPYTGARRLERWDGAAPAPCLRCGRAQCPCAGRRDHVRAEGGCAFGYRASDLAKVRCFVCGAAGHLSCAAAEGPAPPPSCWNCGGSGHAADACARERPHAVRVERGGAGGRPDPEPHCGRDGERRGGGYGGGGNGGFGGGGGGGGGGGERHYRQRYSGGGGNGGGGRDPDPWARYERYADVARPARGGFSAGGGGGGFGTGGGGRGGGGGGGCGYGTQPAWKRQRR